ncbi:MULTISPECIES: AAA family ATPase [unclassified Microcoleus]|uniref:AAA family ATPase n=1 Tax=unclassified Microcoleus TaxID=2642155 RepID=UPI002FD375C4
MKLEIRNLGVVEKAEIDLKPLTVFIGRNGEGKTWAAYTLSAILGQQGYGNYLKAYLDGKTQETYPIIDSALQQLFDEGNAQIDMIKFANDCAEIYINDVARFARNWMPSFMATERADFEKLQVDFKLEETKLEFQERIKSVSVEREISLGLLNSVKESGETILYFYLGGGKDLNKLPKTAIKRFVIQEIFQMLHRAFYDCIHIFPTERTTFITFPFSSFRVKEIRGEQPLKERDKSELGRRETPLLEPVKRFLEMILTIYQKQNTDRDEEIKQNPRLQEYINLADFLEKEILQGEVGFETTSELRKELLFQPKESTKLEMPIVSSMVKELAPLVLCLRYLVKPNELLIIDEPEMNLHPAAQVEIAEFLAMLVNAGLHVLITTHSPYIVDHLANLMQAAKHEDPDSIKEMFYLERTDAFISQEKVSVYLFEDGTAKNIISEEGTINWETFGQVSDDVSRIYANLLKIQD